MKCERCANEIKQGDEREYYGRMLCEDCYMDALSPARTCDPWAVHSAKSLSRGQGTALHLNEVQVSILKILEETGGAEPAAVLERLKIGAPEFEREIAALRHMEKVRGEMRDGRKILRLW